MCGDFTCDANEDSCSCAGDCGAPAATEVSCADGIDDDCDGAVDCEDSDCSADAACQVTGCDSDGVCESAEDCSNCAADCDGITAGHRTNRFCCGDGTLQSAEGDGGICDGTP